jgi:oligoendopeptidase F
MLNCCLQQIQMIRQSPNITNRCAKLDPKLARRSLFVELELARLDQDHVDGLLDDAGLARFSPWLRRVRAMAPYQLSDEIEKMIAERAPTGAGAWVRLFDETTTAMRFAFQGTDVTEAGNSRRAFQHRCSQAQRGRPVFIDNFERSSKIAVAGDEYHRQGQADRRWLARFCAASIIAQSGK